MLPFDSPVRLPFERPACPATAPGAGGEPCPRCAATMIWTKASWHCLACRYKEGCC